MIQYLLCFLQVTFVLSEILECTTRNNSIGPNGTFVDLSDMETNEMNTREMAAYAERKFLETIKDGELGTWEAMDDSGNVPRARGESQEIVNPLSRSSSSSDSLDVFWNMERKMMDEVQLTGKNDSRPHPAHVRMRQEVTVPSIVNTEASVVDDVFNDAAEEYYDDPNYKPGPISRKEGGGHSKRQGHGNQTFFRGRVRSRKGLTYWLNQPARMFELEGVSIKPSPKHWPDPTHRSYNWTGSPASYGRRPGMQYTRSRQRGGRLRFSRNRNSKEN